MSVPPFTVARPRRVSAVGFVRMLMTPLTAFPPQSTPPGPLTTSMRSTSSSMTSIASQNTPEKVGV